ARAPGGGDHAQLIGDPGRSGDPIARALGLDREARPFETGLDLARRPGPHTTDRRARIARGRCRLACAPVVTAAPGVQHRREPCRTRQDSPDPYFFLLSLNADRAGFGSALPAASLPRTRKTWRLARGFARTLNRAGLVHGFHLFLSSRHSKAAGSLAAN